MIIHDYNQGKEPYSKSTLSARQCARESPTCGSYLPLRVTWKQRGDFIIPMGLLRTEHGLRRLEHRSRVTHQWQAEGNRTGPGTPEQAPSATHTPEISLNSINQTFQYHLHFFFFFTMWHVEKPWPQSAFHMFLRTTTFPLHQCQRNNWSHATAQGPSEPASSREGP